MGWGGRGGGGGAAVEREVARAVLLLEAGGTGDVTLSPELDESSEASEMEEREVGVGVRLTLSAATEFSWGPAGCPSPRGNASPLAGTWTLPLLSRLCTV